MQLAQSMQKNVLHQIGHFIARHSGQQDAVNQRRIHFIEPAVTIMLTFQHGAEIGLSQGQEPIMLEKGKAILKSQQPSKKQLWF